MTVEEKLQHFDALCKENANKKSEKLIREYKNALIKAFEEHKQDEYRRLDMRLSIEKEKLMKISNKKISLEHIRLKKMIGDKRDELREKIFISLENKIEEFMSSKDYYDLLNKQIKGALEFAGDEEILIYVDDKDSDLIPRLSLENGIDILKSKVSFMGGIRAVLPQKHILIDNSFITKIEESRAKFHIMLGDHDE